MLFIDYGFGLFMFYAILYTQYTIITWFRLSYQKKKENIIRSQFTIKEFGNRKNTKYREMNSKHG